MTTYIEDGGPAHPASRYEFLKSDGFDPSSVCVSYAGLSIRDWFAGQAMAGMNASPELLQVVTSGSILDGTTFQRMARRAYEQADAMLAERSKP